MWWRSHVYELSTSHPISTSLIHFSPRSMSAMDVDSSVSTVLAILRLETEDAYLVGFYYEFEDLYERKLWHQLSLALQQFYQVTSAKSAESAENAALVAAAHERHARLRIYDLVITNCSQHMNQTVVVDFLLSLLEDLDLSQEQHVTEAVEKLEHLKAQIQKTKLRNTPHHSVDEPANDDDESEIYVNLHLARLRLLSVNPESQQQADNLIDVLSAKFEPTYPVEFQPKTNAAFYLTKCQLYKIRHDYNEYYRNGLLYLSSSTASLSLVEQQKLCYDLAVAAILGDKIYNFGELILHDILKLLKASEFDWLYHLIHHLNAGNLQGFNEWIAIGEEKAPILAAQRVFLRQKIIIMSLLELILLKPAANKVLRFEEISNFTGANVNDVEHVIIKCLLLGLIKGYINQIESTLVVTWLQLRILNLDQVKVLYDHLIKWDSGVEQLGREMLAEGGTIWAAN
jgi:26S proteasome regulatory subunit N9